MIFRKPSPIFDYTANYQALAVSVEFNVKELTGDCPIKLMYLQQFACDVLELKSKQDKKVLNGLRSMSYSTTINNNEVIIKHIDKVSY